MRVFIVAYYAWLSILKPSIKEAGVEQIKQVRHLAVPSTSTSYNASMAECIPLLFQRLAVICDSVN